MALIRPGKLKTLAAALLFGATTFACDPVEAKPRPVTNYAKLGVPKVGLRDCPSPSLRGVDLKDQFTERGRMERSMRWKNITDMVEDRYTIPRGYLLGMIAQEAIGDPTMPNLGGDGGLGLIHMQPLLADQYGLDMITDSRKLRDFKQGKAIKKALRDTGRDLVELAEIDDRWHPVKNIDAAARMLADHYQRTGSWDKALQRYSGRPARQYANHVIHYAKLSKSKSYMEKLGKDFDKRNHDLDVDGRPLTYKRYVDIAYRQNECQFDMASYRKLPKKVPRRRR